MSDSSRRDLEEEKKDRWMQELERVAIRKDLPSLLNTFEFSRQTGSSTALAKLAQREPISVVVANKRQGESLVRLLNGRIHVKSVITTIAQLPERLLGLHQPLFVDNGAMMQILGDAVFCMRAIPELLSAVRKMRRVLKDHGLWSPSLETKDEEGCETA